jgi:very-short-patch-repair endonuclease
LRKAGVLSEVIFLQVHKGIFWKMILTDKRIIGNYIVDYVKIGLVIEIDGSSDYKEIRPRVSTIFRIKVYRISDLGKT